MKINAIVPARIGSKRIPKKNIRQMNGAPLIHYVLRELLLCDQIDKTYVSTDSEEVESACKIYGTPIIYRPKELCTDTASSESALLHFVNQVPTDILVFVQATSPFIERKDIQCGLDMILTGGYDSVLSVVEDKHFYWNKSATPKNYDPKNRPRTQEIVPIFRETGSFYITKVPNLLESGCRISGKIGMVTCGAISSIDIDTEEDWDIAETISRKYIDNLE